MHRSQRATHRNGAFSFCTGSAGNTLLRSGNIHLRLYCDCLGSSGETVPGARELFAKGLREIGGECCRFRQTTRELEQAVRCPRHRGTGRLSARLTRPLSSLLAVLAFFKLLPSLALRYSVSQSFETEGSETVPATECGGGTAAMAQ